MSAEFKASLVVLGVVLYFVSVGVACYFDAVGTALCLTFMPLVLFMFVELWINARAAFR